MLHSLYKHIYICYIVLLKKLKSYFSSPLSGKVVAPKIKWNANRFKLFVNSFNLYKLLQKLVT